MKIKIISCIFCMLFIIFFSNIVYAKYVIEESSLIATIQIDRTAPNVEVTYSTKEVTKEKVEVTIKANEQIQEIQGWTMQSDKKTLKKEYTKNSEEIVEVKDLAGNITKTTIKVTNIDNIAPVITIDKITNDAYYLSYANKNNKITATITIKDDIKIANILQENDIKIMVNDKEIIPKQKTLVITKNEEKEKVFLLTLSGIEEEGKLGLKILDGVISDEAQNKNQKVEKDTKIQIDNTSPKLTFLEEQIEQGKVVGKIKANEGIVQLNGWEKINDNILKKTFTSNASYIVTIQDYAGNKAQVEVNITKATNITLSYASHNSEIGWSYGHGNNDIAGLEAIKRNAKYKTESLAFSISGNVEKDFLQAKAYVHTYWGDGASARCNESNQIYYHGWNPSKTEWSSLSSKENIILEGKNYIQFGGTGVNHANNTDINGKNPIPQKNANEYQYGISAIQLKLKNYDYYSIVYQIYVDSVGWVKPAKNGEIECYQTNKPISALRITLVPNSELNSLLDTWNKDTRKIY